MSWVSRQICDRCWGKLKLGQEPSRLREEFRETTQCGLCYASTKSGIYYRVEVSEEGSATAPIILRKERSRSGKYLIYLAKMFDKGRLMWLVGAMLDPDFNRITEVEATRTARVRTWPEEKKNEAWQFFEDFVEQAIEEAPKEEDDGQSPEGYIM